jgi:phosphoribosyl 1,2-cyclic phosphodiesterase
MRAHLEFHHVGAEPLKLGDVVIENFQVRHPGTTLGYKIRVADRVIGWVPDNEFLSGHLDPLDELTLDHPVVQPESQFVEFLRGVDLLFHEAQYTDEEYPNKVGWGHSSVGNACALVRLAGVKRWVITHHDPVHDDDFLEGKLNITRRLLGRAHASTEVVHGYDGLSEYL